MALPLRSGDPPESSVPVIIILWSVVGYIYINTKGKK